MRLVIAAPANGAILKDALKAHLQNDSRVGSLVDLSSPEGTYPQLSFAAAQEVAAGRADRAILICGTGVGTAIAAKIRCAAYGRRRRTICLPSAVRWKTTTRRCCAWGRM